MKNNSERQANVGLSWSRDNFCRICRKRNPDLCIVWQLSNTLLYDNNSDKVHNRSISAVTRLDNLFLRVGATAQYNNHHGSKVSLSSFHLNGHTL